MRNLSHPYLLVVHSANERTWNDALTGPTWCRYYSSNVPKLLTSNKKFKLPKFSFFVAIKRDNNLLSRITYSDTIFAYYVAFVWFAW